jgi:hypothetical protein
VLGPLLGYNKVMARTDAELVVRCGADPLLAVWEVGAGRSCISRLAVLCSTLVRASRVGHGPGIIQRSANARHGTRSQ